MSLIVIYTIFAVVVFGVVSILGYISQNRY
jgi:hypothetical protein